MKNTTAILIAFLIFFFCHDVFALQTLDQIIQRLNDSKVTYGISILDKSIQQKDYSDKLNYLDAYRVEDGLNITARKYELSDEASPYFKKAEDFFSSNLDSALHYYHKVLSVQPNFYKVMTYIGQVCEEKNNMTMAIQWFQQSIDKNYIDYMAHWFLADAYAKMGKKEKALEEIVIAKILNRNNPRIDQSFNRIMKESKKKVQNWYFTPQVTINKDSITDDVQVAADEKWIGYAMAKAMWDYEPGYRDSMGVKAGSFSTLEYTECLASEYIALINAKAKVKKIPELKTLQQAIKKGYLNEYILYDVFLPENPYVAYLLPKETILKIKAYILDVRHS